MLIRVTAWVRYCEGLPERRVRPLAPPERGRLLRLRARLRRSVLARLLLAAALPLACARSLAGTLHPGWSPQALTLAWGVLTAVALPLLLLWARDALRALQRLGRDLAAGSLVEFGREAASLAVLPCSGRVVERGACPADLRDRAEIGEAAPVPDHAATFAFSSPGLEVEIARNGLVRRRLTDEERAELRAHAARLRRPPLLVLAGLALSIAWGAHLTLDPTDLAAVRALGVATAAVYLGLVGRAIGRRVRTGRWLSEDVEQGWVLRATVGALAGAELLGASGIEWTFAGAPAGWRVGTAAVPA